MESMRERWRRGTRGRVIFCAFSPFFALLPSFLPSFLPSLLSFILTHPPPWTDLSFLPPRPPFFPRRGVRETRTARHGTHY